MRKTTILKICKATGLVYWKSEDPVDPSWFLWDPWPVDKLAKWVPGWCNCSHPDEVYEWMSQEASKNSTVHNAMKAAGLRRKPQRPNNGMNTDPEKAGENGGGERQA